MWDFEHPPEMERLAERYQIHSSTPSQCAAELADGTADIGLIPIASYATTPGLDIIPGCTVASLDRVRSIILVVRHPDGIQAVRRVARGQGLAHVQRLCTNTLSEIPSH